jgi:8-oxo-dGTP pyrophosphatase MutT (NUDIX family)
VSGFRHLDEQVAHQGYIWRVVVAEFEGPDGQRFRRDIVRSPGAVAVVPLLDVADGNGPAVILVSQFRPAIGREIIEIPAGMRDVDSEPPIDTARRELIEEIGYDADVIEPLTMMHPSVGMTDSTTHLFIATGLRYVGSDRQGPEESVMTTMTVALAEALALVADGTITDAKTALGVLLADRWLAKRAAGFGAPA